MKNIMEKVINQLTDHKAEADIIYSGSKSLKISAQKGAVSEYKVSSTQIMGVRAIKNGGVGIAYTEALDDESLQFMIQQALANAENSGPNPYERILELSGSLLDDKTYTEEETDIQVKTSKALDLELLPKKKDPRVTAVPYNSYSESEYLSRYLSSRGRFTSSSDKVYSITSSAFMEENDKKAMFYDYHSAHTFKELEWTRVIEESVFHASQILNEKTLPTGRYPVRFNSDCLKQLMECFSHFYSAKSAMDKVNPWSEKLGETLISSDLTIVDDPRYPKAFRSTLFDGEGVEAKALTLIENGVLKSFMHNSLTASHFKTKTTGHAYRSPGSSLGISGTHFVIQGKNVKAPPARYLEIIQMDGLYSGANRVTGSFSAGVKGYIWEDGVRTSTFGNITLSGNLMELLKNVEVNGVNILSSRDQSFFSVPLMFNDLSIAGS